MIITDFNACNNKYGIIYSDPPWQQQKGGKRACRPNQERNLDYATLSLPEIQKLHIEAFSLCEDKHNVFMWTIDKYLFETEQMMKELGYTLHARIIWDKQNGVAPAFTVRFSHEYLLWFYMKGNILMPCKESRGVFTTVITEKSTIHSKKPEKAYMMIETMFPKAKKLELFARNKRTGWDSFGNELAS